MGWKKKWRKWFCVGESVDISGSKESINGRQYNENFSNNLAAQPLSVTLLPSSPKLLSVAKNTNGKSAPTNSTSNINLSSSSLNIFEEGSNKPGEENSDIGKCGNEEEAIGDIDGDVQELSTSPENIPLLEQSWMERQTSGEQGSSECIEHSENCQLTSSVFVTEVKYFQFRKKSLVVYREPGHKEIITVPSPKSELNYYFLPTGRDSIDAGDDQIDNDNSGDPDNTRSSIADTNGHNEDKNFDADSFCVSPPPYHQQKQESMVPLQFESQVEE